MRFGPSILAVLLCVPNAVCAKDVGVPADKPALTLTLPDEWAPKGFANGYEATSKDGAVYLAVEVADLKDRKSLTAKSLDALAAKGVELDTDNQNKSDGIISGMKAVATNYNGKYKGADTNVDLIVVYPNEEKVVLLTIWWSEKGKKANAAVLDGIRKSITAGK